MPSGSETTMPTIATRRLTKIPPQRSESTRGKPSQARHEQDEAQNRIGDKEQDRGERRLRGIQPKQPEINAAPTASVRSTRQRSPTG